MKVTLAKTAGFCPGVKRAVDLAYGQGDSNKNVYTFGPIIHNESVVADLESKGVIAIDRLDQIPEGQDTVVIIRSHGISKATLEAIEAKGVTVIDATCPFVKRIHHIAEEVEDSELVIMGDPLHPEVKAICGWCKTTPIVIENSQQAQNYCPKHGKKVVIVAQTTFNYKKFQELVEIISKKGYDISCLNTICNATGERQSEAAQIASQVDAMIVVGGKHSSNTQKLYDICKKECQNTYYIQTLVDLDFSSLKDVVSVGITAGASTPNYIIEEVHQACQN